jgi:HSP20 family protein
MKRDKILGFMVLFLIVVVGFQGYYLYGSNISKKSQNTQVISHVAKINDIDSFDNLFAENPFEQMQKIQKEMEREFNSMNSQFAMMPEFKKYFNQTSISPSINIKKSKDKYELDINIPGSEKNNIKVNTKDGILSVEAKTQNKKDEKNSKFIKKEIFSSSFYRELSLPKDADTSKLKTSYKNGLLKIEIPRKS